ncbi:MAG: glycosyltransferase [Fibrobacteres bacterium]|nr:glycosyltransferase [Fibrobacterota bacterium]
MSDFPLRFGIPLVGGPGWTGGIVYTVNLAEALRSLGPGRPKICAVVSPATADRIPHNRPFLEMCDAVVLHGGFPPSMATFFEALPPGIEIRQHTDISGCLESIDFLYPVQADVVEQIPSGSWIPDFQHHHLPEFFSREELDERTRCFDRIAEKARCVVFSSRDALDDFRKFHPSAKASTRVLHFRSALRLPPSDPVSKRMEMGIGDDFILCSNQFWAHKDHATLFRAIGKLREKGIVVPLVCTGAPSDYRNNGHYQGLLELVENLGIASQVKMLGLVPREDQLALMRCARLLVQPSLFEGWSTVLEDIRCVGTPVVASDLGVHKEQSLENATYFQRRDPQALAQAIEEALSRWSPGPDARREAKAQSLLDENLRLYGQDLVDLATFVRNGCAEPVAGIPQVASKVRSMAEQARRLRGATNSQPPARTPPPTPSDSVTCTAIVSVYKAERFLRGCLDDLLGQSLWKVGQLEIVVVDTGSPEGEASIVREYQGRFGSDRIRLVRTEDRRSIYAAWNLGIQQARGEFLTNANADDRHHPQALQRLVSALQSDHGSDLAYADSLCTRTENETWSTHTAHARFWWPGFDARLFFQGCFAGPHPVWRRSLHDRFGSFREDLRIAGDYEFWLRLVSGGCRFVHIPQALGLYLEGGAEATNMELAKHETQSIKRQHWKGTGDPPAELERGYQAEANPVEAIWSNLCFGLPDRAHRIARCSASENPAAQRLEPLIDQIQAMLQAGKRNEALELVRATLSAPSAPSADPAKESPLAQALRMADLRFSAGDVDGAISLLEPFSADGDLSLLTALGWLETRRGNPTAARGWYEMATSKHPADISTWSNLAVVQIESRDLPAAEASLRQVLSLSPTDPDALIALTRVLEATGRAAEAAKVALGFCAAHPSHPQREAFLTTYAGAPGGARGIPFPKDHCKGRIVAVMTVYNEGDLIRPVIGDLIRNGIDVYLLDNASTDDTVEQASHWLGKGLLHIESYPADSGYPERTGKEFALKDILRREEEVAAHLGADWYLHVDADEFRESPWEGLTLSQAIRKAESEGYSAINYELYNFRPVRDDFPRGGDPRQFLTHWEPGDWFDSVQIKTWKHPGARVDLSSTGGHNVQFPDRKVCPVPFLLRHYPIRGEEHGRKKIFGERLDRFSQAERAQGWHIQYEEYRTGKKSFLHNPSRLRSWNDGKPAREAIFARLETDRRIVERAGGAETPLDAFCRAVDARCGANLSSSPASLTEADSILRGLVDQISLTGAELERMDSPLLRRIWFAIATVRRAQARLAGEFWIANHYSKALSHLAKGMDAKVLVTEAMGARSWGDSTGEEFLLDLARRSSPDDSLLARAIDARSWIRPLGSKVRRALPATTKVSIVIPVHNGTELTRNCLTSLFSAPSSHPVQIVVVDDASTDGTNSYLRGLRDSGRLTLVEHATNQGFAASCNDGAKAATGDVLVFLNNDTIVQPGWLDALVDELVRDDSVGIAGSRLLYPDGRIQHAGMVWEWKGDHPHPEHVLRRHEGESPEAKICLDYPAVTGACLAIPAALFDELDGFSREFGMYCEDVDLCLRVWDKGLRVRYVPASALFHLESATPIDLQARADKSRNAADMLRASWNGRWPSAFSSMPSWMWPDQARTSATKTASSPSTPMARPRIGFDARTLSVADSIVRGIGNYAWHHLLAILETRSGCDLTILHDDTTPPPPDIVKRTESLGAKWAAWSSRTAADFDLFHTPDPMHVYPGYASPFQRFGSTRVTATFHDIIPIRVYEGRIANWPGYLARLDEIKDCKATLLCNSEFTRKDLLSASSIDPRRTAAVMAGFNASVSGRTWSKPEGDAFLRRLGIDKPFFLHVGAADPHKNFESSLAACQVIGKSRPVQFVVAGKLANALGSMRDQILQAGLKDVVFTDYLERDELELLYSRAVATLFLSRYEGFGFPALEAMASGCPVIASNAASIPEIVGDAGLMHEPDDLQGIAGSMVKLLDTPSLRQDLITRGKERARRFDWKEVARRTWHAWDKLLEETAPKTTPPPAPAKTQWISPVWDASGYGDESRAFLKHLASTDLGVGVLAWGRHSESFRQSATQKERTLLDSLMGRELVPGRPVVLDIPAGSLGRVSDGGVHVGRTTFETDGLPAEWVTRCNSMDELWVPCRFNKETFSKAGVTKPILVVPEGVDTDKFRPGLEPLPLPGTRKGTTYLSIFEWTHRKGPDLLLEAWAKSSSASDDVELVLRCYPPNQIEGDPSDWIDRKIDEEFARIGTTRSHCAPIVVVAKQVPDADMPRLYAAADVYLAPSRGEGWGRPHMEAMSCGLAVIATRWSGNLEFQNDDNSWLLDIDGLEEIDAREEFPFYRGQKWAAPSIQHLIKLLRNSASNAPERRRLGEAARHDMVENWDWSKIAPLAEVRLREILRGVPASQSALNAPRQVKSLGLPEAVRSAQPIRWCGQMFNYSGYARLSRETLAALMDADVPVTADPLMPDRDWFMGISADDRTRWSTLLQRDPAPGVLVCCDIPYDADGKNALFQQMQEANPGCGAHVGWTMFETDRLPKGWAEALNKLDEVWVPSNFNRLTFAKSGVDAAKLHVVPGGIDTSRYGHATALSIPGPRRATTFLSVFQWTRRKGWDVLLRAWAQAFKPQADVRLVLRCHTFGNDSRSMRAVFDDALKTLGLKESDMAPIVLLDGFVSESDLPSLYAACDVFVLPSRGEGWGFPFLEAMASGKPCIATAWGASMDFLDADCAWLASPRDLVEVGPDDIRENRYLAPGHRWANPDSEEIAGFLRQAASDIPMRLRKSQNAQRTAAHWSHHRTARAIAERINALDRQNTSSGANLGQALRATATGIVQRHRPASPATPQKATRPHGPHPTEAIRLTAEGILSRHAGGASPAASKGAAETAPQVGSFSIRWEGSQFVHHSLANVNREICLRLAKAGHDLSLIPFEPDQFSPGGDPDLGILASLHNAPLEGPCQVHVRHQWPPRLDAPAQGHWVVVQPWEFGSPPKDWIPAFKDRVDEIWCYSEYVKRVYLEAGIPEEKLAVVPLGVDVDKYRPGLTPLPDLARDPSRTTFLFVGGTIARKGFDCLLNAWTKAFGPKDPVRLVVKGMGGGTFYKGQTGEAMVRDLNASGKAAPVVLFERDLAPAEVPQVYACADVLVHPYRGEGFGLPIAEAMASGLPCIVTKGGSADDFCGADEAWLVESVRTPVPGGKVGPFETVSAPWWLEPDLDSLVFALRAAYAKPEARQTKGRAARARIESGFTWDHAAAKMESRLAILASRPATTRSVASTKFVSALDKLSIRISTPGGLDPVPLSIPGARVDSDEAALLDRLLIRAEAAAARKDFAEAEDLTRQAVEQHPRQNMAWLARAMILRGLGKFRKATEAIEQSLRLEDTPDALLESVLIHLAANELGAARKAEKALKDRHGAWLKAARELFRAKGQTWPLDLLKPAKAAAPARKGKR